MGKFFGYHPMKTGNDWKTLGMKLYSFPKWAEMTAHPFVTEGES